MAAQCPVCLMPMHIIYFFDIELDYCRACGGLWFDGGEMDKILAKKNVPKRLTHPLAYDFSKRKVEEGKRECPRCNFVLKILNHKGVNVDVCTKCEGIWLDRYELSKLMGITEGLPKQDFDYQGYLQHAADIQSIGPASDHILPGGTAFSEAFGEAITDLGMGIRFNR